MSPTGIPRSSYPGEAFAAYLALHTYWEPIPSNRGVWPPRQIINGHWVHANSPLGSAIRHARKGRHIRMSILDNYLTQVELSLTDFEDWLKTHA